MLSSNQASKIVRACIRQACGWDGPIQAGDELKDVGIVDPDMREALNDELVTNASIGVPSEGYVLGPNDLQFTIETSVSELIDELMTTALAGATAVAESTASGGKLASALSNEVAGVSEEPTVEVRTTVTTVLNTTNGRSVRTTVTTIVNTDEPEE